MSIGYCHFLYQWEDRCKIVPYNSPSELSRVFVILFKMKYKIIRYEFVPTKFPVEYWQNYPDF
jgi:hypothetical protein